MEEEERYKIHEVCPNLIVDTVANKVVNSRVNNELDLLNQQDKRIKELEQENKKANINNYLEDYFLVEKENQQLRHQIRELKKEIDYLKFDNAELIDTINSYKTLNLQQQHDLPEKIIGEVENELLTKFSGSKDYGRYIMTKTILDTILKKYGEKNG